MTDPYVVLRGAVLDSVTRGPAESSAAIRAAAAANAGVPDDLAVLVSKIHEHAYRVTDEDVARAQERHGDDALFEIILSAALGASERRLAAGLAALEQA